MYVCKISAQESRRKKKEYVDSLEKRMETYINENSELKRRLENLEMSNKMLIRQLERATSANSSSESAAAVASDDAVGSPSLDAANVACNAASGNCFTLFMVLILFLAVLLGISSPSPSQSLSAASTSSSASSSSSSSSATRPESTNDHGMSASLVASSLSLPSVANSLHAATLDGMFCIVLFRSLLPLTACGS